MSNSNNTDPSQTTLRKNPLRIGIAGLTHGHVESILNAMERPDIQITGIAEPDKAVAQRYAGEYNFSMDLVYADLKQMIEDTQPTAVTAYNSVAEHRDVVKICAPRGIHVMTEKPLAINSSHAKEMDSLARKHNIHLVTNYATSWFPSIHKTHKMIQQGKIGGDPKKIVVCAGNKGPKELGIPDEFVNWLTDPNLNGGGAVIDFGCYGANLITWLMNGQKPLSVSATLQTLKPENYPRVDDEATIVLTYPNAQGIIQSSWNWPFGRKDMAVYGPTGWIYAEDTRKLNYRFQNQQEKEHQLQQNHTSPYTDTFRYLAGIISGDITMHTTDLSSPENNLTVVEILDAARKSADTGRVIKLKNH